MIALALQAGAVLFLATGAQALTTFSPSNLDCMLDFRQLGTANPFDLEVDLGSVTNFYAVPIGNTITISNYNIAQLTNAMAGSNFANVEFSVCAANNSPTTGASANYPKGNMWITYARTTTNVQSVPFARSTASTLIGSGEVVTSLGGEAQLYSSLINPDPLGNTSNAVAIPPSATESCEGYIGPGATSYLQSSFPQQIGQYSPPSFVSAIVSDFYVDYPTRQPDPLNNNATSGNVSLLGYFTFFPNGTMTFTRQANNVNTPPPPAPVLTISRIGITNIISFGTTNGATYTLLYNTLPGLTTARSSWLTLGGSIIGGGGTTNFTDTNVTSGRVYSVTAH
jgi:hypothetical protein